MSADELKKVQTEARENLEGESISKIRDILFGNNMTEYEKKFHSLDTKLHSEVASIQRDFEKRVDDLEQFIKAEFKSISSQLKQEETERNQLIKKLTKENENLANKLLNQKEKLSETSKDLRKLVLDKSKEQANELKTVHRELKDSISESVSQLDESKIDRSALAVYLTEMALKISGDSHEDTK
ncbi:MAG: hypothetical protein HOD63_08265 [Bacteroidetes bacterium]|nr:hypothetical protein [Bacteroidota bacterium]MBT5530252.1 hypothetical protein [Cytophagia bacterium]MBT3801711.1 hypothetical protein [Bacteroidota bacterium]MBT4338569.1 hypothetical protein [Bacteroidota bacterium]MBT4729216.1 hypothetical protein [Bacteroidota bacterium]